MAKTAMKSVKNGAKAPAGGKKAPAAAATKPSKTVLPKTDRAKRADRLRGVSL